MRNRWLVYHTVYVLVELVGTTAGSVNYRESALLRLIPGACLVAAKIFH